MQSMRADLKIEKEEENVFEDSSSGEGESSHTFESEDLEDDPNRNSKLKLTDLTLKQRVIYRMKKLQIRIETSSVLY